MENNNTLSTILSEVTTAKNLLIIYDGRTNLDIAASAISLFCWSKQKGLDVQLVSTSEPIVEHNTLVGIDKALTSLPKRNLVISLDYEEDRIDKVVSHLNEEDKKLLLIVQPKSNAKPLDTKNVHFDYEGVEYDQIITFNVGKKHELEKVLGRTSKNLSAQKLVAIGGVEKPDYECKFHLPCADEECLSADFAQAWQLLNIQVDSDIASNLMMGLDNKTEHFAKCQNPAAFTLAAWLLDRGARRHFVSPEEKNKFVKEHLPGKHRSRPRSHSRPNKEPAKSVRSEK
ncbi:MAG: hypothetical protein LBG64_01890 [Pseudomonadales bacterium]|jgi:hypothetical protein|nr:hypothetical protein [Pseudomonadales bacterium]